MLPFHGHPLGFQSSHLICSSSYENISTTSKVKEVKVVQYVFAWSPSQEGKEINRNHTVLTLPGGPWRLSSQAESSRLFCHWNSAHHFLAFFFTASNSCFRVGQHAHFLPLKFLEPFIAKKMSWGHGFGKLL